MPPVNDRIRIQTSVCFVIVLIALLCAGRTRMVRDPGTLWHTVAGERMLDRHEIIRTDSFSFTQTGEEWIAQQWLAECAMAVIHRLAGLDGLLLITCAMIAWIFSMLFWRSARAGLPAPLVVLFLLFIAAASSYHFMPRPHIVTLLFMTFGTSLLCDIELGRVSAKWLLVVPFAMALWTNLHGGALGGLASLVVFALALLCRPGFLRRPDGYVTPHPIWIGLAVGLSTVAILANPFGVSLPRTWLGLMDSKVLPKLIIEHAPTDLFSEQGTIILTIAGVYFVLLGKSVRTGVKSTWLLPAIWFVLALSRIRHAPIFALVAAVVILDMVAHSPFLKWPSNSGQRFPLNSPQGPSAFERQPRERMHFSLRRWLTAPAPTALLIVMVSLLLQAAHVSVPVLGANWCRLDSAYWPVEATAALNRHLAAHPGANRVFNDMRYGGYLIYKAPRARVYIDDRCELYRDSGLLRYVELLKQPERIDGESIYRGIDYALVRSDSPSAKHLTTSANWSAIHHDATAALFVRNAATAASKR